MVEKKWLRQDVAEWLQSSVRTIDYLVRTNQIPYIRISKRAVRFDPKVLEEWVRSRANVEYRRGGNKQPQPFLEKD